MINPNVKGSAVKRGVQAAGVANKSPMGPTNRKSEPALFSGGVSEMVSSDANGNTVIGKGQKKPFKSSEDLTENFQDFAMQRKREKFRTQKPGGPNEVGGGLY
jgi:hypothetical protein